MAQVELKTAYGDEPKMDVGPLKTSWFFLVRLLAVLFLIN